MYANVLGNTSNPGALRGAACASKDSILWLYGGISAEGSSKKERERGGKRRGIGRKGERAIEGTEESIKEIHFL